MSPALTPAPRIPVKVLGVLNVRVEIWLTLDQSRTKSPKLAKSNPNLAEIEPCCSKSAKLGKASHFIGLIWAEPSQVARLGPTLANISEHSADSGQTLAKICPTSSRFGRNARDQPKLVKQMVENEQDCRSRADVGPNRAQSGDQVHDDFAKISPKDVDLFRCQRNHVMCAYTGVAFSCHMLGNLFSGSPWDSLSSSTIPGPRLADHVDSMRNPTCNQCRPKPQH